MERKDILKLTAITLTLIVLLFGALAVTTKAMEPFETDISYNTLDYTYGTGKDLATPPRFWEEIIFEEETDIIETVANHYPSITKEVNNNEDIKDPMAPVYENDSTGVCTQTRGNGLKIIFKNVKNIVR